MSEYNSTANGVVSGFVEMDILADVSARIQDRIPERIPLDPFVELEDIVGMAPFLASHESSYMTGQVLGSDGGMVW